MTLASGLGFDASVEFLNREIQPSNVIAAICYFLVRQSLHAGFNGLVVHRQLAKRCNSVLVNDFEIFKQLSQSAWYEFHEIAEFNWVHHLMARAWVAIRHPQLIGIPCAHIVMDGRICVGLTFAVRLSRSAFQQFPFRIT